MTHTAIVENKRLSHSLAIVKAQQDLKLATKVKTNSDSAMGHELNEQSTGQKGNLARFFIEQQHVAWVSLAIALLWGMYGLFKMPQRKDPDIPVRQAMIIVPWQGTSAPNR